MEKYFNASQYLQRRFTDPTDKERGVQPFYLKSIHDFYQRFGKSLDPDTARLLEYGGGPVLYSLISTSPYVHEVTFSDYQKSSLDAIIAWKNGHEGHHDWTPYFSYVITELEGCQNNVEETISFRQDELKKKLKHFLIGDLHAKDILVSADSDTSQDSLLRKFDVVSTNFCIEAVAKTVEEYQSFMCSIMKYVRPGGFITSLVSLEESFWLEYPDNVTRRFHLSVTEEDVTRAYEMAGFTVVMTHKHEIDESARFILNDCKAIMFIAGQKQ